MPAAEAKDSVRYELAFHVLPTVAEGEVSSVFESLKAHITKNGGEIFDEEAPARFDLAYEIIKYLEGRNRKFTSAYFGWVRFNAEAAHIEEMMSEIEGMKELLRHLLIKLTKVEEENPFRFHEALATSKVETVEVEEEDEDSEEESIDDAPVEETTESADAEDGDEEKDAV